MQAQSRFDHLGRGNRAFHHVDCRPGRPFASCGRYLGLRLNGRSLRRLLLSQSLELCQNRGAVVGSSCGSLGFRGDARRGFDLVGRQRGGVVRHIGILTRFRSDRGRCVGICTHENDRNFAELAASHNGDRPGEFASVDAHLFAGRNVFDAVDIGADARLKLHPAACQIQHLLARLACAEQIAGEHELFAVVDRGARLPENAVEARIVSVEDRQDTAPGVHAGEIHHQRIPAPELLDRGAGVSDEGERRRHRLAGRVHRRCHGELRLDGQMVFLRGGHDGHLLCGGYLHQSSPSSSPAAGWPV